MPHELFGAGLKTRGIYPELSKYFYKENSDVTWEEFLRTKFGLWIDTRLSTNNTLHSSSRAVEKIDIMLQIERASETGNDDLMCYILSLIIQWPI